MFSAVEALSKDELLALLRAAKAHRERDWLLILVAFWHGLRASEVTGMTAACIQDGFLTIARLKGSLKTTQELMGHADPLLDERKALIDFVRGMHGNQRVFPISRVQFWRLVQQHAKAAGIPRHKAHPHVLKHSIAMQTIDRAGIHRVRKHLGHKSISSTGAYLEVSDGQASEAIRRAVEAG